MIPRSLRLLIRSYGMPLLGASVGLLTVTACMGPQHQPTTTTTVLPSASAVARASSGATTPIPGVRAASADAHVPSPPGRARLGAGPTTYITCGWAGRAVVYDDRDGNGRMDATDAPLAGVRVTAEDRVRARRFDTTTQRDGTATWYNLFDVAGPEDCDQSRFVVYVQVGPGFRPTTAARVDSQYPTVIPDPIFAFGLQRSQ